MTNTFIGSGSQFDHTYDLELPGQIGSLPADPKKRETITEYIKEAVEHKKAKDDAAELEKDVYDSVKDSEANLEISLKYFKQLVAYAYDTEKKQQVLNELEAAKEGCEILGVIVQ